MSETSTTDLQSRVSKLPPEFQARFERFRRGNQRFDDDFGDYELFVCEQALTLARALGTQEAIADFKSMDISEQIAKVKGWSEDHTGNTQGCAIRLAHHYVGHRPSDVTREHGALAPLVGCDAYGCTHDAVEASNE